MGKKTKTFMLTLKGGDIRKLTIPSHYTITFGPMVPGVREQHGSGKVGQGALRVYNGKTQLACFTDCVAFRDTALVIEERRTHTKRETVRKETADGFRDVEVEARVTEWVDPDKPRASEVRAHATRNDQLIAAVRDAAEEDDF